MNSALFAKAVASPNSELRFPLRFATAMFFQNVDWEFLDAPLDGVV